jgi:hypothetical protein
MRSVSYGSLRLGIASLLAAAALFGVSVLGVGAVSGGTQGHVPSTNSSLSLVLVNSTDGLAHWGQQVTFNVSTDATAYPYVNLRCYQYGNLVADGWAGFFPGALGDQTFGLYSPQWTGGAANCTAYLDMNSKGKWKQLASTSFQVEP